MSVASVGFSFSQMPMPVDANRQGAIRQDTAAKPENKVKPLVIESATKDLQKIGNAFNKKLQFVIDHQSNQVIVKVIDKDTDKVIRELPPEELQRLHQNLREAIGLIFDEMA